MNDSAPINQPCNPMKTRTGPSPNRKPVTVQVAREQLSVSADDARAAATELGEFLAANAIESSVAVSLSLRASRLLQEATEHLDTAVARLEVE